VTGEQGAFGSRLRRARERREITLESVAASTKISRALLGSLEKGDASQWPKGIYRRAFVREYANAVGLSPDATIAEFLRLFPEHGDADRSAAERSDMRLTLACDPGSSARSVALRALSAALDCAVVLTTSAALAISMSTNVWPMAGAVALLYHTLSMLIVGGSPAFGLMSGQFSRRANVSAERHLPRPSSRELLRIVASTPRTDRSANDEDAAGTYLENARSAS